MQPKLAPIPKSGVVALLGRPNAGKSSLLNAMVGSNLSIVTPKAQTTRALVRGILTTAEGQILLLDTPGVHEARPGGLNERMVKEASESLRDVDLVWYLVDPKSTLEHEAQVLGLLRNRKVCLLITKSDLHATMSQQGLDFFEASLKAKLTSQGCEILFSNRISTVTSMNTDRLLELTWQSLPEGLPLYPDAAKEEHLSDRPTRFFAAELIRKQLFLNLEDEIPYSCAVDIDDFKEGPQLTRIKASIWVERDSQKGIVIGQGGKKIKSIGIAARAELEELVGTQVFLELSVRLEKNWTKNERKLDVVGFQL